MTKNLKKVSDLEYGLKATLAARLRKSFMEVAAVKKRVVMLGVDQEHISTDHREHLGRWSEAVATMVGSVLPELKGILQELKTTAIDNVATVAGPRLEAILSVASTKLASLKVAVDEALRRRAEDEEAGLRGQADALIGAALS